MSKSSGHEKAPSVAALEASGNVNQLRKNVEMNDSTAVTAGNLPRIMYSGKLVVTTSVLAHLYGTDDVRIRQNYDRNADRFVPGKHFIKVEGAELKDLKNSVSQSYSVEIIHKQARSVLLWTERGAARHAKMLDTDKAWEMFEALEDSYFGRSNGAQQLPISAMQTLIGTVIGSDGEHVLDQVIDQKANALPPALRRSFKHTMKSRLRTRFSVQKTALIPAEELANACNFVAAYVFEGELLPKHEPVQIVGEPHKRYLLAFDHKGQQSIEEISEGAFILSKRELMEGMVATPGDIPVSIPEMFQFLMAAVVNLKSRYEYMTRRSGE